MKWYWAFIAVLLLVGSFELVHKEIHYTRPQPVAREVLAGQPAVIMKVLSPGLEEYAQAWQIEVARRFPNSVVIFAHGQELKNNQWFLFVTELDIPMPLEPALEYYHNKYPDRTVVLLSCNDGHLTIHVPGVYYAKSKVWLVPDRAETEDDFEGGKNRASLDPDAVGNIFEFVKSE